MCQSTHCQRRYWQSRTSRTEFPRQSMPSQRLLRITYQTCWKRIEIPEKPKKVEPHRVRPKHVEPINKTRQHIDQFVSLVPSFSVVISLILARRFWLALKIDLFCKTIKLMSGFFHITFWIDYFPFLHFPFRVLSDESHTCKGIYAMNRGPKIFQA